MIELLSIDLSNYCSKQCPFCYNHSNKEGNTLWSPQEVIAFASDCVDHGVRAVSLGGGEPFEYEGVFDVIDALYPKCYLSVTTNGLPLEKDEVWENLMRHCPDKIHITIHQPQLDREVSRVENMVKRLCQTRIKPGLNLLVGADKIEESKIVYARFLHFIKPEQIILVPQRYGNTPTPKQLSLVTSGKPFQSPSCLLGCAKTNNFASVSWDKKVNYCSYTPKKQPLETLDYNGLANALSQAEWGTCVGVVR